MPIHCDSTSGRKEGERRKQDALLTLEAIREFIVEQGRRALLDRLQLGGTATADDVRDAVEVPTGVNPKCLGAVPGALARAGIIRAVGFAKSSRPEAHARPVTNWELADRGKAEAWLAAHPPQLPKYDDRRQTAIDWPTDDSPDLNKKGDAAVTASPQNLSPASNGELIHES